MHATCRFLPFLLRILLPLAILAGGPGAASAEPLRGLGDAPMSVIRRTLEPLLPQAVEQMDRYGAERAVVYAQRSYNTSSGAHVVYDDQVWWIRSGDAQDLANFVRDYSPGVGIKTVKAFRIRAGSCDPAAALAAPIEMVAADRIRITPGDTRSKRANLVIAFENAEPGDLIGVSIETYVPWSLSWATWLAAERYPVVRAETRVKCEPGFAYALFGSRFRKDQFTQEVFAEDKTQKLDFRVRLDALPPMRDEPYAPPGYEQSPQITVSFRAWRARTTATSFVWIKNDLWNQVAIGMAQSEGAYLARDKDCRKKAQKLAEGLPPHEAAEAVFRFVRDDLMDIDSDAFLRRDDQATVDSVLKTGSGSPGEKAYVLLAMLRAIGQPAELVWAHDPARGDFFEEFPDWGQLGAPLVRTAIDGDEHWFDLGCKTCPAGSVRERLWDAEAVGYDLAAAKDGPSLIGRAVKDAYNQNAEPYALYVERLAPMPWSRRFRIGGQADRWAGWCEERIAYGDDAGGAPLARCSIRSVGPTPVRFRTGGGDAVQAVGDWLVERFGPVEKAEGRDQSAGRGDTLSLDFTLDGEPLAAPMGDTWILPPEAVYGAPSIGAWPERRVTAFKVPYDRKTLWEFTAPLPAGWSAVEVPEGRIVDTDRIMYRLTFDVADGRLHVRREQVERAGVVADPAALDYLGAAVATIHELERTPVVLRRREGGQ